MPGFAISEQKAHAKENEVGTLAEEHSTAALPISPDDTLLTKIHAAWRRQEKEVESARFVLTGRSSHPGNPTYRSERYEIEITFSGSKGWSRVESRQPVFHIEAHEYRGRLLKAAFDGRVDGSRSLWQYDGDANPIGTLNSMEEGNAELGYVSLRPVILSFRAFTEAFVKPTLDGFTVTAHEDIPVAEDVEGVVLLKRENDYREIWVNRAVGFPLRRLVIQSEEDYYPHAELNVTKIKHDGNVWLPVAWTCTYMDGTRDDLEIAEYHLNPSLGRDDFRIEFEKDMLVTRNDLKGSRQQFWRVDSEGELGPIASADFLRARRAQRRGD
jgi:hypothetical protein